MRPIANSNGYNRPRLVDELVSGIAAMVDDGVVGREHPVRQPLVAHELPHVLLRVQFGALRRERDDGDVGGREQLGRDVPPGLVQQQHGMAPRGDLLGDRRKVQGHASVLHHGKTSAAPLPSRGQIAPKM